MISILSTVSKLVKETGLGGHSYQHHSSELLFFNVAKIIPIEKSC
ncbi:MAG: hypothetical protein ACLTE2_02845 [Eubacteriales bacterium]